ncbi:MAG: hypothetical protein PHV35_11800, partial [Mariniphaga sp.]|nr:hypothetical protein [Mariniphaga sp.]
MKPVASTLPEFYFIGNNSVTSPKAGQGRCCSGKFIPESGNLLLQVSTRRYFSALRRCPGTYLAFMRPLM